MSVDLLKSYVDLSNIADELAEEDIKKIEQQVKVGFDEDFNSMQDWLMDVKKVMELASLKSSRKSTPLPQSANVKFPLITKAAYEFSSRTYPEIIKDGQVVKTRVIGKDWTGSKAKQAERVSAFMNYQLMFENCEWEADLDKLLTLLALVGFICKKTYFDPIHNKNKSEICEPESLIIHTKTTSIYSAERISHIIPLSLNELISHVRSGLYCEEPVNKIIARQSEVTLRPVIDVIEQHCFLDLDDDNYAEPYIVTTVKETGELLRIAARFTKDDIYAKKGKVTYIEPVTYFTDYHFLPSPKGNFQSVGFGILMLHLNASINTILNQIIDAGTLTNLQGGYIDARAKVVETGNSLHDPGELKKVKTANGLSLKDSVHMIDFKEPSNVLYQTLGLLIQTSRDLSSANDVMTGSSGTDNVKTGAVLALQEEGRKVITGINKRVYRALTEEFKKIFRLNFLYLDPDVYVEVLDDELAVQNKDFDSKTVNVVPVADPNLSSEANKAMKAQFLAGVIQFPGVKPEAITRRILTSTNVENPDELLMSEEEMQQAKQAPNPEMLQIQADMEHKAQLLNIEGEKINIAKQQLQLELLKIQSEIVLNRANAMKAAAQADQATAATQTDENEQRLKELQMRLDHQLGLVTADLSDQQHQDEMSMRQKEVEADAKRANKGVDGTSG